MPRKKKTPTPAKPSDTLDRIPTFTLARDLYESERKEIYTGIRARLSELKSQRKKVADTLGIKADEETQISRVIAMYEGDEGILALFQNAAEEESYAAEEVKKGGKDKRQREIPLEKVPSESTDETRASTDPVGVDMIDRLVTELKAFAPSDLDWDAFRRNAIEMSSDERDAILNYAYRCGIYERDNDPTATEQVARPQIPGHLHSLFCDLSPAYAMALGGRDDVLFKTDMARAMSKAKTRRKKKEEPTSSRAPNDAELRGDHDPNLIDRVKPITPEEAVSGSWESEPLRTAGEEPVAPLAALAEQESK